VTHTVELEASFLAASIPAELKACPHVEIEDVYFPASAEHARTRIRRKDDEYEFTKKVRVNPEDAGYQQEFNIDLTAEEYAALATGEGKKVSKVRYYLPYEDLTAEVDIFSRILSGLVIVEFEFNSLKEKESFVMPDFCLADVTQEKFIAGGVLAGKSYHDLEPTLTSFGYNALIL